MDAINWIALGMKGENVYFSHAKPLLNNNGTEAYVYIDYQICHYVNSLVCSKLAVLPMHLALNYFAFSVVNGLLLSSTMQMRICILLL